MRYTLFILLLAAILFSAPLPLRFSGNEHIKDDLLYGALSLRKPYALEVWEKPPAIEPIALSQSVSALTSFYRAKGFYHARLTSETTNDAIIITIQENDPITIGNVTINSPLKIDSVIGLHTDDLFDQEKFSETKGQIKKKYGEAGYCNAEFNSKAWVDIETDKAYLLFEATPNERCTFGPIVAESTPNIDGDLPVSMLRFKEGDPYNLNTIRQSYETLYAQESITRAVINDNERNGSVVPITLNIEETEFPIRFTAGLGYSSDQGLTAQTGIKHRNIFGNLKTLALDARYSQITQDATGTFTMPLANRGVLGASIGYKNEQFDGYSTKNRYEKVTAKYQGLPTSILVGVLFDHIETYDSTDTATFPQSILFITSPLGELNYDTRDKPLDPTKGVWLNAKVTGALRSSAFSDATYFKPLLSAAYIHSIDTQVLGAKIKWGTLRVYDGDVPSSYRFYAGGMNSNRAYTYRGLGPKNSAGDPIGFSSLIEGTLEYRFPIYGEIRGILFNDITFASEHIIPDYAHEVYWGVGGGLRYVTPIGPIALDVGVNPNDTTQYAIHFRIGELF